MSTTPYSDSQTPEIDRREHAEKNVGAKRSVVYGYDADTDSYYPVSIVVNADGTYSLSSDKVPLATRLDNTASPILYLGKAPVGSATSSAVWQIAKLDTTSGLVKTWADGNSNFDNVWDDILTITYS